jgi:hypothetical protein
MDALPESTVAYGRDQHVGQYSTLYELSTRRAAHGQRHPSSGGLVIRYADPLPDACRLTVHAGGVWLESGAGLCFDGRFGLRTEHEVRVFGHCLAAPDRPAQRAVLQVDACPPGGGGDLRVTLRGADGGVLLGPRVLQRLATAITGRQEPTPWTPPRTPPAPAAWPAATR